MLKRTLLPLILVLLALSSSGCLYSREIAHTRRDIERQVPEVHFEREVVLSLGPMALRTLRWISGLVPEEEAQQASLYLRDVSRVKVGVYRSEDAAALQHLDPIRLRRFERDGWETAVHAQEEGERVWVLYRERRGAIRDLYVVVLNEEELVLARLKGRLDQLFARIMADHFSLQELGARNP